MHSPDGNEKVTPLMSSADRAMGEWYKNPHDLIEIDIVTPTPAIKDGAKADVTYAHQTGAEALIADRERSLKFTAAKSAILAGVTTGLYKAIKRIRH